MHTYKQTLLQQLGFSDPDKKDCRHDQIVRFFADPPVTGNLLATVAIPRDATSVEVLGAINTKCERPIMKGLKDFRSIVGFIDFCAEANFSYLPAIVDAPEHDRQKKLCDELNGRNRVGIYQPQAIGFQPPRIDKYVSVAVEVKVRPVSVGDILRQINLYREFVDYKPIWVVAFHQDAIPSKAEVQQLRKARIVPIQVDKSFEEYRFSSDETSPGMLAGVTR